jgi:hypothetical protein
MEESKSSAFTAWLRGKNMVEGDGFEPPNHKELIYSQPRLATSLSLHKNGAETRT